MHLSKSIIIGVKVCQALMYGQKMPAPDIAEQIGEKYNTVSKVCQRLRDAGIVTGKRGPKGGQHLPVQDRISLLDIVEAVDPIDISLPAVDSGIRCLFAGLYIDSMEGFDAN